MLREEVLPVLVLTLKLVVSTLNGGFLALKLSDLLLKFLHLLSLLHTTTDSRFSVLKAFSCLFVLIGLLGVVLKLSLPVLDLLLHVL